MTHADGSELAFLNSVSHLEGHAEIIFGSALEHGSEGWGFNNSTFDSYCESFGSRTDREVWGEDEGLAEIIERQIGYNSENIGLDIAGGSNGRAIRDLIAQGVIGTGLVTNLFDLRSEEAREDGNMHHISGDIIARETWQEIIDWRKKHAPEGFSLIMHRPMGALQGYPAPFYVGAAYLLLDMLKPGGVFFTQIPDNLRRNQAHEENVALHAVCEAIQDRTDIEDIASNGVYLGVDMHASPNKVVIVKKQSR